MSLLVSVLVIRDKITSKSRGYGFVTFENPLDAEDAAKGMEGTVSWLFISFTSLDLLSDVKGYLH